MIIIRRNKPEFVNQASRVQTILGWIYFPVHLIVLPLLLNLLSALDPARFTELRINEIYFSVSTAAVLAIFLPFLRKSFDTFLDRLHLCVSSVMLALIIDYAMSLAAVGVLALVDSMVLGNPNETAILNMAAESSGAAKAMTVFLAPMVEELLYRGVVFGSIRTRSRGWAYGISVALFSLSHVWLYAVALGDWRMLLYAVQYVPISVALTWAYERSGSIWTTIFFHMGFNAISLSVLKALGM